MTPLPAGRLGLEKDDADRKFVPPYAQARTMKMGLDPGRG
jgi:hypothetical protein